MDVDSEEDKVPLKSKRSIRGKLAEGGCITFVFRMVILKVSYNVKHVMKMVQLTQSVEEDLVAQLLKIVQLYPQT